MIDTLDRLGWGTSDGEEGGREREADSKEHELQVSVCKLKAQGVQSVRCEINTRAVYPGGPLGNGSAGGARSWEYECEHKIEVEYTNPCPVEAVCAGVRRLAHARTTNENM